MCLSVTHSEKRNWVTIQTKPNSLLKQKSSLKNKVFYVLVYVSLTSKNSQFYTIKNLDNPKDYVIHCNFTNTNNYSFSSLLLSVKTKTFNLNIKMGFSIGR